MSATANLGEKTLTAISMPAFWTPAGISIQVSPDGGTTFQELYNTSGAVSFTAAASLFIQLDPQQYRGINCIKIRSGTSGTPVNQIADAVISLIVRGIS